MALKTTTEQLEEVQAAIAKIAALNVRSFATPGGPQVTHAGAGDLAALTAREELLLKRLRRESGGSFVQVATRLDPRYR